MNTTTSTAFCCKAVAGRALAAAMLIGLVSASPLAAAQGGEQRLAQIKSRLNLSSEQIERAAPVLEKSLAAQRSILASYGIDLDILESGGSSGAAKLGLRQVRAMRQELEGVRADTVGALKGILNDQQLDELKRTQDERKAEIRERIRARR